MTDPALEVVERVQRWLCMINDEGNYDDIWATTEHSGDCPIQAWLCTLCQKERITRESNSLLALLQPGDDLGGGNAVYDKVDVEESLAVDAEQMRFMARQAATRMREKIANQFRGQRFGAMIAISRTDLLNEIYTPPLEEDSCDQA